MLIIDYLPGQSALRLTQDADGKRFVFDPIRRKNMVLTPEELLRQLVLQYFLEVKKYPANRIRVEIGIELNGLKKRCDIVVFDAQVQPWLLVECKSPKIALRQDTFEQAARYNLPLRAPYLAVTNGLGTLCCALDLEAGTVDYLDDFPDLE